MDKESRLKEDLRMTQAGEIFLENVELSNKQVEVIPLEKLKEILDGYDGSIPSMITCFSEIQKLVESED